MINGLDDQEDLLSFILRELMTLKRQWSMQMEWSWMAGGFEWIIQSPKEHIRPPQASTWAGQHMEEVVAAERVVAGTHIMIGGMTEDMTDMKNMTTDTGDDHHHLIIVDTDRDQDPVPIVQGATEDQKSYS